MGYRENYLGCRETLSERPSEYLKRCFYDTALSDTPSLMLTYERVGNNLMLGTDHPYSTEGVQRTVRAIQAMTVSSKTKVRIFGGNVLALLH